MEEFEDWSHGKVLDLLKRHGVNRYTFDYEAKVVSLYSLDDLYTVMRHIGVVEVSNSCRLSMMKWKNKVCLQAGEWQFEAQDTRE